jgi:hypothetical protein
MANVLWTVRLPGESRIQGRFYASGSVPISSADKIEICHRLGIWLTPDTLFEPTHKSADESSLPPEPGLRGRKRKEVLGLSDGSATANLRQLRAKKWGGRTHPTLILGTKPLWTPSLKDSCVSV